MAALPGASASAPDIAWSGAGDGLVKSEGQATSAQSRRPGNGKGNPSDDAGPKPEAGGQHRAMALVGGWGLGGYG